MKRLLGSEAKIRCHLNKGLATSAFLDHNTLEEIWLIPSSDEFLYKALVKTGRKNTLSLH